MTRFWALAIFSIMLFSNQAFAEILHKDVYIKAGASYVISFDEKISDCKYDKTAVNIENLSSILSSNNQLLLKSKGNQDSVLTVTTSAGIYTFHILKEPEDPTIIELDSPPHYQENNSNADFEIDQPPTPKKD